MSSWTLFSNHGHVLVCLARNSESRLRDVAENVGITERAVQKIVRDLQVSGMVSVTKQGRRNRYRIHRNQTLRHDLESHCTLGELIKFVKTPKSDTIPGAETVSTDSVPTTIEPVRVEPDRSETPEQALTPLAVVKSETAIRKPEKSEVENSIERQQGSLF